MMTLPKFDDNFQIVKCIGSGGNSDVFLVEDNKGNKRAAKIPYESCESLIIDESETVSKFDETSPLLKYYGLFDYNGKPVLIMDYFEGWTIHYFFTYKLKSKLQAINMAKIILKDICKQLIYLHKLGICACDIHNGNILVNDKNVFLIDFRSSNWALDLCPELMAAHLFTDIKFININGDIFEQMCKLDTYNLADTILELIDPFFEDFDLPDKIDDPKLRDILTRSLDIDINKRPTPSEILELLS